MVEPDTVLELLPSVHNSSPCVSIFIVYRHYWVRRRGQDWKMEVRKITNVRQIQVVVCTYELKESYFLEKNFLLKFSNFPFVFYFLF